MTCSTDDIPINNPMRKKRQCQQCGLMTGCVYVKTKAGFRSVCVPCAKRMRSLGMLVMPDLVIPMGEVF